MSKILLTGASGFLGLTVYSYLKSKQFNVITLSRSRESDVVCDLSKNSPLLLNESIDLVIHSAGKAHSIPRTETQKQEFYDVNVIGTQNLLKGLENTGLPKQFIFISSVSVYGLETGLLIKEDAPLLAKDPYGLSKISAEHSVADWCAQNNVVCTILRLPLLVGDNPPGNLGAMINAIEKGFYFNIGGGKAKKSMVLASDVAHFIPIVAAVGGIYNLTDGTHPSFAALSVVIATSKNKKKPHNIPLVLAKLFGFAGDLLEDRAPINSMKIKKISSDLTFDDSKARKLLQWMPQHVLEYFIKNPT
jgi:nucleoside-diphosphate-sugar epimerase